MKNNTIYVALLFVCSLALGQGGNWETKSSLTTSNTLIGARFGAISFSINGKGYYGTGSSGSSTRFKDFWSYDPLTDCWTQVADFGSTARSSAISFVLNGNGYVGGGFATNGPSGELLFYAPSTNSWTGNGNILKALTTATNAI